MLLKLFLPRPYLSRLWLSCIVYAWLLTACNPATSTATELPTNQGIPKPTAVTPQPSLGATNTSIPLTPVSAMIRKIASGEIRAFWWDRNAQRLFYSLPTDTWEYSVISHSKQPGPLEQSSPGTPNPSALNSLPANAELIGASPSGQKIIYVIREVAAITPKSSPEANGEQWTATSAEMWLAVNGNVRSLGQIEYCGFEYLWSNAETRVVATAASVEPCSANAWLIDLDASTIRPLFPKETTAEFVTILSLSPDGERLLCRLDDQVYMIDLMNGDKVSLDLPARLIRASWVDQNKVLIAYNMELGGPLSIALKDITSESFVLLIGPEQVSALNGEKIFNELISPDLQWLAFMTSRSLNDINRTLWIAPVPSP